MTDKSAPKEIQKRNIDLYKNTLTHKDVETIVEKSLGPNYKIHNYYVKNFANENLGYMGAHRNVIIEVSPENSPSKELHTYFLKSVSYNIDNQAQFLENSGMFLKETRFYNQIMPELMKSSKDKSWAPQCYLVKDDVLIFENLIVNNYKLSEEYLDLPLLEGALSSLAKMHAASILAEKRLGKTFLDLYPEILHELVLPRDGPFAPWYRYGTDALVGIAKYLELNHEVVPELCDKILDKVRPSETRRNVMCHGDGWSNNLMFNGTKCALVDFQSVRYVPSTADLTLLIHYAAKQETRDKHEKDLLRHYHKVLAEILKDGGEESVLSFEDVVEEYEEWRPIGIVLMNMYFQINKIDKDKQAEMMSSSEGFTSLIFENHTALILEMMETDKRYRDIMSLAVRELVEIAPKYVK